jgi:hypothetical protein
MTIVINEISQDDADQIRDSLPRDLVPGLDEAFQGEKNDAEPARRWAFPNDLRTYLIARVDGVRYLLVGINTQYLHISSFARIVAAPRGHAAECMRRVVGDWLVPRLRATGKRATYCRTTTPGGWRVLTALQSNPPAGIKAVTPGTAWTVYLA